MVTNSGTQRVGELLKSVSQQQQRGDFERAARTLVRDVDCFFENGHWRSVPRLLEGFPPESFESFPGLFCTAGRIHAIRGEEDAALSALQKAYLFGAEKGQFDTAAQACLEMTKIYQRREDFRTAQYYVQEAGRFLAAVENGRQKGDYYFHLAQLCPDVGMLKQSIPYAKKALEHFKTSGELIDRFKSLRLLAGVYRQLGYYNEAASRLEIAARLYTAGDLPQRIYGQLLNQQAHLAWYRGCLTEALRHASALREFADEQREKRQSVYARILLGNLYRALEDYGAARRWYADTRELALKWGFEGFLPWVDIQMGWLEVLTGHFGQARILVYRALETADRGQRASFNVVLAGLNALDGHLVDAKRLLLDSLDFYFRSGDELSVAVIQLILSFVCLQSQQSQAAAETLKSALRWFSDRGIDTFPHWWHPRVVAEVCVFGLTQGYYTDIARRMLLRLTRQRGTEILQSLLDSDDARVQRVVAQVLGLKRQAAPDELERMGNSRAKVVLAGLLEEGFLRQEGFGRLLKRLTTAQHRRTVNPTIAAVFCLYLRGLSRREIAAKLQCSSSLVKNYITEIYQIFGLEPGDFKSRRARKGRLLEAAQREGFVAGKGSTAGKSPK